MKRVHASTKQIPQHFHAKHCQGYCKRIKYKDRNTNTGNGLLNKIWLHKFDQ